MARRRKRARSTVLLLVDYINHFRFPRAAQLAGLRVLVAHGRDDRELSFAAGELLRDFAIAGGADVLWLPYDGGHELPLVVWRALKKLLR